MDAIQRIADAVELSHQFIKASDADPRVLDRLRERIYLRVLHAAESTATIAVSGSS